MQQFVNPDMIVLAREARGLTQNELAGKLKTYKAAISRLESGDAIADEETIGALGDALCYPSAFFSQRGKILPASLAYRKRQKVPAKLISSIEAQMNIIRRHAQFITRALEKPKPALPVYAVDEKNNPAKIAALVRKKWNIITPVMDNLAKYMEQQGIIISSFDFGTERVDSRSMLTDDQYPVIFLNRLLSGDRQRFSLAFELGHLVMHTYTIVPHERDINHEANLFAAELLMPAKEIIKDFNENITLPLLGELKRKWKVSMIALFFSARSLLLQALCSRQGLRAATES